MRLPEAKPAARGRRLQFFNMRPVCIGVQEAVILTHCKHGVVQRVEAGVG